MTGARVIPFPSKGAAARPPVDLVEPGSFYVEANSGNVEFRATELCDLETGAAIPVDGLLSVAGARVLAAELLRAALQVERSA